MPASDCHMDGKRSPLGAAIRHFLNNRVALARFLEDGVASIDNGVVERTRPSLTVCMGRPTRW